MGRDVRPVLREGGRGLGRDATFSIDTRHGSQTLYPQDPPTSTPSFRSGLSEFGVPGSDSLLVECLVASPIQSRSTIDPSLSFWSLSSTPNGYKKTGKGPGVVGPLNTRTPPQPPSPQRSGSRERAETPDLHGYATTRLRSPGSLVEEILDF